MCFCRLYFCLFPVGAFIYELGNVDRGMSRIVFTRGRLNFHGGRIIFIRKYLFYPPHKFLPLGHISKRGEQNFMTAYLELAYAPTPPHLINQGYMLFIRLWMLILALIIYNTVLSKHNSTYYSWKNLGKLFKFKFYDLCVMGINFIKFIYIFRMNYNLYTMFIVLSLLR